MPRAKKDKHEKSETREEHKNEGMLELWMSDWPIFAKKEDSHHDPDNPPWNFVGLMSNLSAHLHPDRDCEGPITLNRDDARMCVRAAIKYCQLERKVVDLAKQNKKLETEVSILYSDRNIELQAEVARRKELQEEAKSLRKTIRQIQKIDLSSSDMSTQTAPVDQKQPAASVSPTTAVVNTVADRTDQSKPRIQKSKTPICHSCSKRGHWTSECWEVDMTKISFDEWLQIFRDKKPQLFAKMMDRDPNEPRRFFDNHQNRARFLARNDDNHRGMDGRHWQHSRFRSHGMLHNEVVEGLVSAVLGLTGYIRAVPSFAMWNA